MAILIQHPNGEQWLMRSISNPTSGGSPFQWTRHPSRATCFRDRQQAEKLLTLIQEEEEADGATVVEHPPPLPPWFIIANREGNRWLTRTPHNEWSWTSDSGRAVGSSSREGTEELLQRLKRRFDLSDAKVVVRNPL
jgi:hypothetical protein